MSEPFRDGRVHVYSRKCDTCIYRPGNLMHLTEGVRDELEAEAVKQNTVIVCHEHDDDDDLAVCRGFYDVNKANVVPLSLGAALGILAFVDPPEQL